MKESNEVLPLYFYLVFIIFFNAKFLISSNCASIPQFSGKIYVNGMKLSEINKKMDERVRNALCEAYEKIESCINILPEEKSRMESNRNKGPIFKINFVDLDKEHPDQKPCGQLIYDVIILNIKYLRKPTFPDSQHQHCCTLASTLAHELLHRWMQLGEDYLDACKINYWETKCVCPEIGMYKYCECYEAFSEWKKKHEK